MDIKFGCSSCTKESNLTIPTARILVKMDELFSKNDLGAVGRLLAYWENEAKNLGDDRGLLEILNEKIGYFRRTSDSEKGLAAASDAFALIEKFDASEQLSSATVYLNGATTMKAFGKASDAMDYYEKARKIYEKSLEPNDYRLAAYHNNISSAYRDLGDLENAKRACLTALEILKGQDEYLGEVAVTHVNLAHIYYDADPCDERIYEHMEKAWKLLSSNEIKHDGNYAFIASKCYPSFGFFGYFEYKKRLKEHSERIYEGN